MQVVYSFWFNSFTKFTIWQPFGLLIAILFSGAQTLRLRRKAQITIFFMEKHIDSYPLQKHEVQKLKNTVKQF